MPPVWQPGPFTNTFHDFFKISEDSNTRRNLNGNKAKYWLQYLFLLECRRMPFGIYPNLFSSWFVRQIISQDAIGLIETPPTFFVTILKTFACSKNLFVEMISHFGQASASRCVCLSGPLLLSNTPHRDKKYFVRYNCEAPEMDESRGTSDLSKEGRINHKPLRQ